MKTGWREKTQQQTNNYEINLICPNSTTKTWTNLGILQASCKGQVHSIRKNEKLLNSFYDNITLRP